jgi:flagellum-specific peptidoglycan hydrolase FlgJ
MPFSLTAQMQITKAYIQQYKEIAMKEMKRTGIPASITLAQAIVESSSGESNLAKKFNNHFGIKCKTEWKGETTYQDDDSKQECFRVYPNAESSFIDHSNFLKNRPNYASLFELDPVDDTAWAYGLKKAGYATANDYPKKLLKVIDDYELAQYNFPEIANEPDDAPETDTTVKKVVVPISVKQSADSTLLLNKVIGVESTTASTATLPTMPGVGSLPKEPETTTIHQEINNSNQNSQQKDSAVKKPINKYPNNTKFKINHVPAIWAVAGRSYLEIANTYQVPLYKLYEYNELIASDLVIADQLIFLGEKKKESNKKVHIIKEGENLYDISQAEGIQLSMLKAYNQDITDKNLIPGKVLYLFNMPKDTPPAESEKGKTNSTKSENSKNKKSSIFEIPLLKKKK